MVFASDKLRAARLIFDISLGRLHGPALSISKYCSLIFGYDRPPINERLSGWLRDISGIMAQIPMKMLEITRLDPVKRRSDSNAF